MKTRFFTGPLSAMLLFAPLAYSQASASKTPDETRPSDGATTEARRQGRVALTAAGQSPSQTMSQAIAFERYKELAAEREARQEGMRASADRRVETPRPVKAVKKPRQ